VNAAYAIAGLILGGAAAWLALAGKAARSRRESKEELAGMTIKARNLSGEVAALKERVAFLEEREKDFVDLAVLMPSMVKKVFSAGTAGEAAENICRACSTLAGAGQVAVFLADRSGRRLGLDKTHGLENVLKPPLSIAVGDGLLGFAGETGRLVTAQDVENDTAIIRKHIGESGIPGYDPEVAVPMEFQGILYGVIGAGAFADQAGIHRENLRSIGAIGAAALENVRLLERFSRTTGLDRDTGLPGADAADSVLLEELERVYRFEQPMGVLELRIKSADLRNPALTRDVMSVAANHLKQLLRSIDTCIRLSHDGFLLILPGTSGDGLRAVIEKLGGELPGLRSRDESLIGDVMIRNLEVAPGGIADVAWVRKDLEAREFEEFGGRCGMVE